MKQIEIKKDTLIREKGFDISIGRETHQIAIVSQSTDNFTPFEAIRKGGRLSKIKRLFKHRIVSHTHFFFEQMTEEETLKLIKILK
jgi:hypothetical protein